MSASCGEILQIEINVKNLSKHSFKSCAPNPVNISYHIADTSGNNVVFDGLRTELPCILYSGSEIVVLCKIQVPDYTGDYVLIVTLVQEDCFWFEELSDDFALCLPLHVEPSSK